MSTALTFNPQCHTQNEDGPDAGAWLPKLWSDHAACVEETLRIRAKGGVVVYPSKDPVGDAERAQQIAAMLDAKRPHSDDELLKSFISGDRH